ncbi:unnamed protein product [Peniophora sp. CBMAI 1063]|nr:unnamed protein product [Peniophora sp. CBMAI 1063]
MVKKSESIARWVIENSARRFPHVFPLPASPSCSLQPPPPGLQFRKPAIVKPKGIRIVPTPRHMKGRRSPLYQEMNAYELAWQVEQEQIQSDYFCVDEEDDFYGPDSFDVDVMDVDVYHGYPPPPDLVVDEGYDEAMDCDYDEQDEKKLLASIYDTMWGRTSAAGAPRTSTSFACATYEEDSTSTESVHCARCHTTYAPRDNGPSACVIPHVFEFNGDALSNGWCASACCGPSVRVRRGKGIAPDEVRATSSLGEPGLDDRVSDWAVRVRVKEIDVWDGEGAVYN